MKLSLLNLNAKKAFGLKSAMIGFELIVKDKSRRTIIERCYDGIYSVCGSKLTYDKGKWFLLLGYEISEEKSKSKLKSGNGVCGCYIGEWNSIYCTNNQNNKVLAIDGGEVEAFRMQIEKKRINILRNRTSCGEGSIGHGYHTRIKPIEKYSDKISNFRKTINHKYSKAIVNYAIENDCGIIVIEDLNGIAEQNKLLKNWSYFDLQTKIDYKAKANQINVLSLKIENIKSVCNECGAVNEFTNENDYFICNACGEKIIIDRNASKNLITGGITKQS